MHPTLNSFILCFLGKGGLESSKWTMATFPPLFAGCEVLLAFSWSCWQLWGWSRQGSREEAGKEAGKQGRKQGRKQAGTPGRCQQPAAFPCVFQGQAALLLPGCWTRCSLPGGTGWELSDSRVGAHRLQAQLKVRDPAVPCPCRVTRVRIDIPGHYHSWGLGSACSISAARERWSGKSRRCEGRGVTPGKGELEFQHGGSLGTLPKAGAATLLELGLFQEGEWASNIFSFSSVLTFVFPAQGRQRRESSMVCLFTCTGFAALSRTTELFPFSAWDN